jgi:uncharacterized repeat protein (TIGR01451 family)
MKTPRARRLFVFLSLLTFLVAFSSSAAQPRRVAPQPLVDSGEIPVVAQSGTMAVLLELTEESAAHAYVRVIENAGLTPSAPSTPTNKRVIDAADAAGNAAISVAQRQQLRVLSAVAGLGIVTQPIYRVQRAVNGIALQIDPKDLSRLQGLSDVKRVIPIETEYPTAVTAPPQSNAVPFMNVPTVWSLPAGSGFADGTGIRIGIIDTGIDYIHPDFGGSGLLADYTANNRTVAPDAYYPTAKVVGGTDLAGDNYNGGNAPTPDPDPMDCNGHGSHVAGIAAGLGVTATGATYAGPYSSSTSYQGMRIQPGVAPKALLYAIRVFGCGGGTGLTVQGIDWAMDPNNDGNLSDHLDVINMSLGSPFGSIANTSSIASDAAASIGMSVVISAGNDGDTFYIAGAPGTADKATTVAASVDDGVTAGNFRVNSPAPISGYYVNGTNATFGSVPPAAGISGNLVQALDPADGAGPTTTDGCSALTNPGAIAGNIAFIDRGTCGFAVKAKNAQNAGAIAVVIAGNASPFGNMGGVDNTVTIPAILTTQTDGNTLRTNLGAGVNVTLFNGADTLTSFSSRGARGGSASFGSPARLKPDVSAPGLNITSAQSGTTCTNMAPSTGCIVSDPSGYLPGGQVLVISGTSMSCPQITGLSALLKQINPTWTSEEIKAAVMNGSSHDLTSLPQGAGSKFSDSRVGAGRTDAPASAQTASLAFNADEPGTVSVSFAEDFTVLSTRSHNVRVENKSNASVTYSLSIVNNVAAPGMSFSLPGGSTLTMGPLTNANISVLFTADPTLIKHGKDPTVTTTQVAPAPLNFSLNRHWLTEASGYLIFSIGGVEKMRVPLYATSRPASVMSGPPVANGAGATGSGTLALSGAGVCTGVLAGSVCTGTFPNDEVSLVTPFELQVVSPLDPVHAPPSADIQYGGVAYDPVNNQIMFGISTYGEWGSANETAFDVYVDADSNGTYDRILFSGSAGSMDSGLFGASASGTDTMIQGILNISTSGVTIGAVPFRYVNGDPGALDNALLRNNTVVLSATPAQLGLAPGVTTFKYKIVTCPGRLPLCLQLNGFRFDQAAGPYTWDYANQGLNFNGTRLAQDLPGATLPVTWNTANLAANGGMGALLLHTHNKTSLRAQYIPLAGATTADLGVTINVGPVVVKGQNTTIAVTLTNNGPSTATNAQVAVTIPPGMTYVSDNGAGTFSPISDVWTVASIASGATLSLNIVVNITSDSQQIVAAQVGGATPLDPNGANNLATAVFAPAPAQPIPALSMWALLLLATLLVALGALVIKR